VLDLSNEHKNHRFKRMSLGSKLKELRLKKGKSLQDVADSVSASKPHIWELERGTTKNPSLDLLKNLAKYFSVTLDYLTGESEENDAVQAFARSISDKGLSEADLAVLENMANALGNKNNNVD